ncbi:MAG TPA: type I restriction endonuclease, partial [Nitrolancea sp.]|nr:type I restriction endonuclease [Nitrolancea sp.]
MSKHREKTFEDEVVAHLTANGWRLGNPARYDRARALYPDDVLGWLRDTQPQALAKVAAPAGQTVDDVVLDRLAAVLDKDGPLRVLRRGFKHINAQFAMCQFKPSQGLNPDTLARYAQVRCTVIRQVRYSRHKGDSIDLVFFVNGLPVATAELKTDFTQRIHDAIKQYRQDRPPRDPAANQAEPLLTFKRGALVHFAVSTDEVAMTTRLAGPDTHFLPFNLGHDGGAGNPPNPDGYRTAYLWERVLQRDSLLDILGNFLHLERTEEATPDGGTRVREALIFPRYHQWEAVGRLLAAARDEGPGHNYLIQHSAGSGKSNSIAWLAHRLATLHDDGDRKVFDSVIVVTDRTVLDRQLQETIYQFEHKSGVVVPIKDDGPSKSEQLKTALLDRAPIIIVTLQTFPFVVEAIRQQASLRDRAFAVIADEAHSSQTGSAASNLARVLTAEQLAEGEEVAAEDVLLAAMEARAAHRNISYFAFTATPKAKTLQRFGRRPNPALPESDTNLPEAFHVYTMQQAIEEGFILDVLQNYTTYRLAFRLAHNGAEYDEAEVDRARALKSLMRWVRLHPYNIAQKVEVIVEHFHHNVLTLLEGRAKAMVVTGSRKEAVRYKLALDAYVKRQGYRDVAALVAFSGEVGDPESGPDPFSEHSMNPGLKGRDI